MYIYALGGQNRTDLDMKLNLTVSQYGCWELSSGPLEEQKVLLTPEPFLYSPVWDNFKNTISVNTHLVSGTVLGTEGKMIHFST